MNNRFERSLARHLAVPVLVLVAGMGAGGCSRQMMPTPNLYSYQKDDAFDHVPAEHRNNTVDVLYVTDRAQSGTNKKGPTYGYGRSPSLAFGSAVVEIGRDLSWDEVAKASTTGSGRKSLPLSIKQVREIARCPDVPFPVAKPGPRPEEDPATLQEFKAVEAQLHAELASRLAPGERKDVYIYVHGFANTFEDAMYTAAELWHFLGRQGVIIGYTWPAGRGMSGRGYEYDTASSEFTVFHLKQLLRSLGRCPQVDKIHILAHSRGTDTTMAALRELNIEHKYAEQSARDAIKLRNLVLAAPDIDFEVFQQRGGGERLAYLPERATIYTSPNDRALEMADILTLGVLRVGQVAPTELPPRLKEVLAKSPMTVVQAIVSAGILGHSYFVESPAVSSDIILMLRDNRSPGQENGRPLKERIPNFYEIRDDYLKAK